jgi:hypothetical protein
MPANYVLLERIELNASAASVTFSNIPQTGYTDLKVVVSARSSSTNAEGMYISFNGSSASFTGRYLLGDGANALSGVLAQYAGSIFGAVGTANVFNNTEIYIPNYTSSNNKSFSVDNVAENNATTGYQNIIAGLWSNTAAITSLTLTCTGFLTNSTFSLYGLAAVGTTPAIAPKASGGNIATDGTYWIHTFNTSGTFTPQTSLSCDALVIAGGGGGGARVGGGGGAGGYRAFTAQSVSATPYTITIGAGGAGGVLSTSQPTAGSDSLGISFTSSGGGKGGNNVGGERAGGAGGSGGGANGNETIAGGAGNTPSTSPSQGNNGGTSNFTPGNGAGGGGGGASAVGATASAGLGGAGGAGVASSITGTSVTRAGGGGGGCETGGAAGAGGAGGGGAGAASSGTATAGTVNTGGGGGGGFCCTGTQNGGNGGSGVVIIRYTIA